VSEREQGNVKRKQTVRMRIVGVCASGRCVYVCVCVCAIVCEWVCRCL